MAYKLKNIIFCAFCLAACILFSALGTKASALETDTVKEYSFYSGPTEYSDAVGVLTEDDTVAVLSKTNDMWFQIRTATGSIGYCKSHLLQINYRDDSESSAQAITNRLTKLFISPDANATVAAVLPVNFYLKNISETENGFSNVCLQNGKTGYVFSDAIEPAPLCTAIVRPIPELTAHTGLTTDTAVKERLNELSEFFTAGRYWNDYEVDTTYNTNASFALSDTPCQHENTGYSHCNYYTGAISSLLGYSYGSQCVGYAGLLSDLIFGTEAPVTVHSNFEQLRVGDHIRLVLWDHSMLVTEVGKDENGKTFVYVTEVNADYETCKIDWGRKFTQDDLRRLGDYIEVHSRYPQTE